jgi:hypothetical protein
MLRQLGRILAEMYRRLRYGREAEQEAERKSVASWCAAARYMPGVADADFSGTWRWQIDVYMAHDNDAAHADLWNAIIDRESELYQEGVEARIHYHFPDEAEWNPEVRDRLRRYVG